MTAKVSGSSGEFFRAASRRIGKGQEEAVPVAEALFSQVKNWLNGHGVECSPAMEIPMGFINETGSRNNQAREEAIVAESVERYATAMKTGAVFPPIVGYYVAAKFMIIDGNNRHQAAKKAGFETIPGVIIPADTPSELITLLTIEANANHGVRPDHHWQIEQAFQLLGLGYDMKRTAAALSISPNTITAAKAARDADQRARQMKIAGFGELPQTCKQLLNPLGNDEQIFYNAATVAVRTEMNSTEVRDMVRDIKAQKTHAGRLEVIAKISEDRAHRAAVKKSMGKPVSSPLIALSSSAGKFLKIDPNKLARQILTASDRDRMLRYVEDMGTQAIEIMTALEKLTDLDADG